MKIKILTLTGALYLVLCAVVQANQTPANDDGGGNTIFFDRHQINCGFHGLNSFRLFRPTLSQIAFAYQCTEAGETSNLNMYTPANDDGGGNLIFLDRHGVDCYGKAIQYVHLQRPSSTQIAYHYKCGSISLTNLTEYHTPANSNGGGNAVFLDRHNIDCPDNQVLSHFRLQTLGSDSIRYHYTCGIPDAQYKELKVLDLCVDGSRAIYGDNVYLHRCHGGTNQKWHHEHQGLIRNNANPNLCIAANGSLSDGANAILVNCDSNNQSQRFNHQDNKLTVQGQTICLSKQQGNTNIQYRNCENSTDQFASFGSGAIANNTDPFHYLADVFNSYEVRQLANALQIDDFTVQSINIYGTSVITGRIRQMSNNNPLGLAVGAAVGMRKYLTADNRNDIPVIITLTNLGNYNFEAKIKLELVRGWREVNPNTPVGTQVILNNADLVLVAEVKNGEVTRKVGFEGAVYIKPTEMDNWLSTYPSFERELSADPRNDLGLEIRGACNAKPNQSTDPETQCIGNWDVLNTGIFKAYSRENKGHNYFEVSLVGTTPTGSKIEIREGQFLNNVDVSGQWQQDENGTQGQVNVQLNGLDNKVAQVISEHDFTGLSDYNHGLQGAFEVTSVSVTKELNGPSKIHVMVNVLGENVEVIYSPQSTTVGYFETAKANQDLLEAVAEAIGRVIANKTGLGKLVTLVDSGLEVVGLRGGTQVLFDAVGETYDSAGNLINETGNIIGEALGIVEDIVCLWFC